jgi:hypothetical protein
LGLNSISKGRKQQYLDKDCFRMKIQSLNVMFVFIICVLLSSSLFSNIAFCSHPKSHVFHNVNLLIIGRCRTISSDTLWLKRLFIGFESYFAVITSATLFERIRVFIIDRTTGRVLKFFRQLNNSDVFFLNNKGVFFWNCEKMFSVRPFPPNVFVWCHTSLVWVYDQSML